VLHRVRQHTKGTRPFTVTACTRQFFGRGSLRTGVGNRLERGDCSVRRTANIVVNVVHSEGTLSDPTVDRLTKEGQPPLPSALTRSPRAAEDVQEHLSRSESLNS